MGFCGINDTAWREKTHGLLAAHSKLRLAWFYGREFCLNPALINSSLLDSLSAYASPIISRRSRTSSSTTTSPGWRRRSRRPSSTNTDGRRRRTAPRPGGSATAPRRVLQLHYHRVAGFTENDTFRSNQICERLITRDKAAFFAWRGRTSPALNRSSGIATRSGSTLRRHCVRTINAIRPMYAQRTAIAMSPERQALLVAILA